MLWKFERWFPDVCHERILHVVVEVSMAYRTCLTRNQFTWADDEIDSNLLAYIMIQPARIYPNPSKKRSNEVLKSVSFLMRWKETWPFILRYYLHEWIELEIAHSRTIRKKSVKTGRLLLQHTMNKPCSSLM